MLDLIAAAAVGVLLGTLTGITPGLHSNLVAAVAVAFLGSGGPFSALPVAVAVVVMAVTHTFADFVPAVFLGAPEASTALGVLPGHRLLLQGRGYEAVVLTVVGSVAGLFAAAAMFPLALIAYPFLFPHLNPHMHWVLLAIIAALVLQEKTAGKRLAAVAVVVLAGTLGVLALDRITQPLLPLFSGLFGVSMLLQSMRTQTRIPVQHYRRFRLPRRWLQSAAAGSLLGGWMNLLPAVGPAQAAAVGTLLMRETARRYLLMTGAINTAAMLLSLASLYSINKARNGAIEELRAVLPIEPGSMGALAAAVFIALPLMLAATLAAARIMAALSARVPYRALGMAVICGIAAAVMLLSGWQGMLVLATATAVGLLPISAGISRSHAMSCLIVPVIAQRLW